MMSYLVWRPGLTHPFTKVGFTCLSSPSSLPPHLSPLRRAFLPSLISTFSSFSFWMNCLHLDWLYYFHEYRQLHHCPYYQHCLLCYPYLGLLTLFVGILNTFKSGYLKKCCLRIALLCYWFLCPSCPLTSFFCCGVMRSTKGIEALPESSGYINNNPTVVNVTGVLKVLEARTVGCLMEGSGFFFCITSVFHAACGPVRERRDGHPLHTGWPWCCSCKRIVSSSSYRHWAWCRG